MSMIRTTQYRLINNLHVTSNNEIKTCPSLVPIVLFSFCQNKST